jgi:hypothetical protein
MRRYFLAALCAALALSACEGARNNTSWSHRKEGTAIVPPLTKPVAATDSTKARADTTKAHSASSDSTQSKRK